MNIQKIRTVVLIFSGLVSFMELMSVSRFQIPLQFVDLQQGAFDLPTSEVQVQVLPMLKLVSLKSSCRKDLSEWGTQAEACNIGFLFVYRPVEHAVFVVLFSLLKVGNNIYLVYKKICISFDCCF